MISLEYCNYRFNEDIVDTQYVFADNVDDLIKLLGETLRLNILELIKKLQIFPFFLLRPNFNVEFNQMFKKKPPKSNRELRWKEGRLEEQIYENSVFPAFILTKIVNCKLSFDDIFLMNLKEWVGNYILWAEFYHL